MQKVFLSSACGYITFNANSVKPGFINATIAFTMTYQCFFREGTMEKTLITPAINMPIFKPKEEIVELISLLMPWAQPLRSHQIVTQEIGVILHTEGIVQLSSIEDDYIIWQVSSPNVFCLSEVLTGLKIATYRRFKSKLWFVPRDNVLQALNGKPELWAAVSTILAFQLSVALYRDRLMSERKTSEIG